MVSDHHFRTKLDQVARVLLDQMEMCSHVEKLITDDPKLSIRDLEELTGINRDAIHHILRDELKLRHVFSAWVPHDLTPQNRENRVAVA